MPVLASLSSTGCVESPGGGVPTCTIASVPGSGSAVVTLVVSVSAAAVGPLAAWSFLVFPLLGGGNNGSIVLALTVPIQWIWTAGAVYGLQGPLHWRNGVVTERARATRFSSRGDTR